jgi:dipeptidase
MMSIQKHYKFNLADKLASNLIKQVARKQEKKQAFVV